MKPADRCPRCRSSFGLAGEGLCINCRRDLWRAEHHLPEETE